MPGFVNTPMVHQHPGEINSKVDISPKDVAEITNMGVINVRPEGLVLREIAPGLTVEDIINSTEAELMINDDLKVMEIE